MSAAAGSQGPSDQETALLEPVRRGDWTWYVLALAALAGAAFVAGAMLGGRRAAVAGPALAAARAVETLAPGKGGAGMGATEERAAARQIEARVAAGGKARVQGPGQAPEVSGRAEGGQASRDGYLFAVSASPTPPQEAPLALPARAGRVYLHYRLPGWPEGGRLKLSCRLGNIELPVLEWHPQTGRGYACGYFAIGRPAGWKAFKQGIYLVRLEGPEGLVEEGSFAILEGLADIAGGQPPAAVIVSNLRTAAGVDKLGRPVRPAKEFPADAEAIYACFDYSGAVAGIALEVRWFLGEGEVAGGRATLRLPGHRGRAWAFIRRAGNKPLPEGKWRVGVFMEGAREPLAMVEFRIVPPAGR